MPLASLSGGWEQEWLGEGERGPSWQLPLLLYRAGTWRHRKPVCLPLRGLTSVITQFSSNTKESLDTRDLSLAVSRAGCRHCLQKTPAGDCHLIPSSWAPASSPTCLGMARWAERRMDRAGHSELSWPVSGKPCQEDCWEVLSRVRVLVEHSRGPLGSWAHVCVGGAVLNTLVWIVNLCFWEEVWRVEAKAFNY